MIRGGRVAPRAFVTNIRGVLDTQGVVPQAGTFEVRCQTESGRQISLKKEVIPLNNAGRFS